MDENPMYWYDDHTVLGMRYQYSHGSNEHCPNSTPCMHVQNTPLPNTNISV